MRPKGGSMLNPWVNINDWLAFNSQSQMILVAFDWQNHDSGCFRLTKTDDSACFRLTEVDNSVSTWWVLRRDQYHAPVIDHQWLMSFCLAKRDDFGSFWLTKTDNSVIFLLTQAGSSVSAWWGRRKGPRHGPPLTSGPGRPCPWQTDRIKFQIISLDIGTKSI